MNQEQKETTYAVALQIDGQDALISYNGTIFERLEFIVWIVRGLVFYSLPTQTY